MYYIDGLIDGFDSVPSTPPKKLRISRYDLTPHMLIPKRKVLAANATFKLFLEVELTI